MFQLDLTSLEGFGQQDARGGLLVPLSGFGFPAEEGRPPGLLKSILQETLRDFGGAGKVIGATVLSPLDLLGLEVPLSFEDIRSRDVQGALMVAALGAGGVAGGLARGLPLITRLGGAGTATGRAAATALTEAAAGTVFGGLRPLEEDESRLEAILIDAGLFAGIGAGASFSKSAFKAAFGGKIGQLKEQFARSSVAIAGERMGAEALGVELAGVRLLNPKNGEQALLRRSPRALDTTLLSFVDKAGKTGTARTVDGFDAGLAEAIGKGFTEPIGPFRTKLVKEAEKLDPRILEMIADDGQILPELRFLQFGQYQAVREAAAASDQARKQLTALAAEVVAPATEFSPVKLNRSARRALIAELGKGSARLNDPDLLRQGVLKGLVDMTHLENGVSHRALTRELFINSMIPDNHTLIVNRVDDLFLKSLLISERVAKLHPVINPLFRSFERREVAIKRNLDNLEEWIFEMKVGKNGAKVQKDDWIEGVKIIERFAVDETGNAIAINEARNLARQAAQETGNEGIIRFVNQTIDRLGTMGQRAVDGGILSELRTAYFPIANSNRWRVGLARGAQKDEFHGFYSSQKEAVEVAERVLASDPTVGSWTVTPRNIFFEDTGITPLNPAAFAKVNKAITEAMSITSKEARGIMEQQGIVAAAPRTATRIGRPGPARERRLGLRDFSKKPEDAMRAYFYTMERAIGYAGFDKEGAAIIGQIPRSQKNLIAWSEQLVADALGVPRPIENAFDALVGHLGVDIQPRALRRWSAGLRKWEGFSRLGGFWSPVANLTQIPINTFPVLGLKWTSKGMEVLLSPEKFSGAIKELQSAGLDLAIHVPLTAEGRLQTFGTIRGQLKSKRFADAAYNISLFLFNGAERVNRLVTAWGAYQRELAAGKGKKEAARIAEAAVKRTQFNYNFANMPQILRGPVGATLLQFKSFVINEIDFIAQVSRNPRELARLTAAIGAIGGVSLALNMPGTDLLDAASLAFSDRKFSEALKLKADDPISRGIIFGLPGALGQIDLSDYVGVGTIRDITSSFTGPAVSDIQTTYQFFKNASIDVSAGGFVTQETRARFLQQIMPSALRRYLRGQDILNTGEIRDPYKGKLLYRPENRLATGIQQIIGAPPLRLQQERIMDQIAGRVRERYIRIHAEFAREAARSWMEGKRGDIPAIKAEALQAGIELKDSAIRYQIRELQASAQDRRLKRTPKQRREVIEEAYDALGIFEPNQLGLAKSPPIGTR